MGAPVAGRQLVANQRVAGAGVGNAQQGFRPDTSAPRPPGRRAGSFVHQAFYAGRARQRFFAQPLRPAGRRWCGFARLVRGLQPPRRRAAGRTGSREPDARRRRPRAGRSAVVRRNGTPRKSSVRSSQLSSKAGRARSARTAIWPLIAAIVTRLQRSASIFAALRLLKGRPMTAAAIPAFRPPAPLEREKPLGRLGMVSRFGAIRWRSGPARISSCRS